MRGKLIFLAFMAMFGLAVLLPMNATADEAPYDKHDGGKQCSQI